MVSKPQAMRVSPGGCFRSVGTLDLRLMTRNGAQKMRAPPVHVGVDGQMSGYRRWPDHRCRPKAALALRPVGALPLRPGEPLEERRDGRS